MLWICKRFLWIHMPSVREVTLKDMGKIGQYQTSIEHNKPQTVFLWDSLCSLGLSLTWINSIDNSAHVE